jgi:hypothetical protein
MPITNGRSEFGFAPAPRCADPKKAFAGIVDFPAALRAVIEEGFVSG